MSDLRYYIQINPFGDIVLVYAGVGVFSENPFPIQMRDEYGNIPSYAERGARNRGCLPVNFNDSNEIFTRIEISEDQFQQVGNTSFFHWYYNKNERTIALRPDHIRIQLPPNQWKPAHQEYWQTDVIHAEHLERYCIAYGGRPMYWLKKESGKTPEDYPGLYAQRMLHPLIYKPDKQQEIFTPRPFVPFFLKK